MLLDDVVLDDDIFDPLHGLRCASLFDEAGVLVPLRPDPAGGENLTLEVAGEQLSSYCLLLRFVSRWLVRLDREIVNAHGRDQPGASEVVTIGPWSERPVLRLLSLDYPEAPPDSR